MSAAAIAAAATLGTGAATAPPASSSTQPTVFYNASQMLPAWHPDVRPHVITFGATSNLYIKNVRWQSWQHATAHGSGTLEVNQCRPSCARGKYRQYLAAVGLYRIRHHHGRAYFTRLGVYVRHRSTLTFRLSGHGAEG